MKPEYIAFKGIIVVSRTCFTFVVYKAARFVFSTTCVSRDCGLYHRNKRQTAERQKTYFNRHPNRSCVIIVGDKPGDADVNYGVAPDERCLKIGYFDHSDNHPHTDLPRQILPGKVCGAIGGKGEAVQCTPQLLIARMDDNCIAPEDDLSGAENVPGKFLERQSKPESDEKTKRLSCGTRDGSKDKKISLLHMVQVLPQQHPRADEGRRKHMDIGNPVSLENHMKVPAVSHPDIGQTNNLEVLSAPPRPTHRIISSATQKVEETDGMYGRGTSVSVEVEVDIMLKAYREKFDVVAHGGHSMDLVSVAVRHLVGDL